MRWKESKLESKHLPSMMIPSAVRMYDYGVCMTISEMAQVPVGRAAKVEAVRQVVSQSG